MKKSVVLLVVMLLLSVFVLTACDLYREPWPASEDYEPAVEDRLPDNGKDDTAVPTGAPTIDPDYNG
ncbi:MAG: hypothetical protein E7331_02355 [Clostridiales bacterium]|nr:hypothetical protein [Clostridiales bacterium]